MEKACTSSQLASRLGGILTVVMMCLMMTGVALGEDRLIVKNASGTETFKVMDDGSVVASGNVAIGATSSSVPLLVQTSDTGHLATFFRATDGDAEIQIGQSTAVNKAAVIGFNQAGAYYYMSVYGLGSNRLVFNSSGYLGGLLLNGRRVDQCVQPGIQTGYQIPYQGRSSGNIDGPSTGAVQIQD
jgi:hypothetical protein